MKQDEAELLQPAQDLPPGTTDRAPLSSAHLKPHSLAGAVVQRQNSGQEDQAQLKPFQLKAEAPVPKKANHTGLPDHLKSGVESLSGFTMDDVKVHYSSDKPAKLNALAYAQGTDIHIAPGQEKHLPHEAWHVVQQKQGRVTANLQMKSGILINDNAALEHEADVMGPMAMNRQDIGPSPVAEKPLTTSGPGVYQYKIIVNEKEISIGVKEWKDFINKLPYRLTQLKGLETLLKDLTELPDSINGNNIEELEQRVLLQLKDRQMYPDKYREATIKKLTDENQSERKNLIPDDGTTYLDRKKKNVNTRIQREEGARITKIEDIRKAIRPRKDRLAELDLLKEEIKKKWLEPKRDIVALETLKQKQFNLEIEANIDADDNEQYIPDEDTTIRVDQGAFMSGDKYGVAVAVRNHPSVILNLLWDDTFYLKKYRVDAVARGFVDERGEPDLINFYHYLHPDTEFNMEQITQVLALRMKKSADEVLGFYLRCGIPPHRVQLRKVTNSAIQMDAYSVGKTTEITKRILTHGDRGREKATETLIGDLSDQEKAHVDNIVDNDPQIKSAPLIVLIWLRKSGAMPGGAYPHLDTYKAIVTQLVRFAKEVYPDATFWMIGDKIYESTGDVAWKRDIEMSEHDLMEYWKSWKGKSITRWNLTQQFYFLNKIKHKTISIGMRSCMLEAPAMMGMRTIWMDHYLSTGKDRMEKYSKGPLKANYKLFEMEHGGKEMQVLHDLLADLAVIREWMKGNYGVGNQDQDSDEERADFAPENALYTIAECIQDALETLDSSAADTAMASAETTEFYKEAALLAPDIEPAELLQTLKSEIEKIDPKKPGIKKSSAKKSGEIPDKLKNRATAIMDLQKNARRRADRGERLRQRVKKIAHHYIQQGIPFSDDQAAHINASQNIIEAINTVEDDIAFRFTKKEETRFKNIFKGFASEIHEQHQVSEDTFLKVTNQINGASNFINDLMMNSFVLSKKSKIPASLQKASDTFKLVTKDINTNQAITDILRAESTGDYRLKLLKLSISIVISTLKETQKALISPEFIVVQPKKGSSKPTRSGITVKKEKKFTTAHDRLATIIKSVGTLSGESLNSGAFKAPSSPLLNTSEPGAPKLADEEEPAAAEVIPIRQEVRGAGGVLHHNVTAGDGNCFFHALYESQTNTRSSVDSQMALRRSVVQSFTDDVRLKNSHFGAGPTGNTAFLAFRNDILTAGNWISNQTPAMVADALRVRVIIHNQDGSVYFDAIPNAILTGGATSTVHVEYTGAHYNSYTVIAL